MTVTPTRWQPEVGELLPFEQADDQPSCRICGDNNQIDTDEVCADSRCQALWVEQCAAEDAA